LKHAELPIFSVPKAFEAPDERELVTLVCSAYREAFGFEKSRSDASRLIKQGSVELDGMKLRDPKAVIMLKSGQILRLDKKHAVRLA
jgi:tyrosyl-tRNA synthetase